MKKLIAKDTLNITSVQSENILPGDKFEIEASAADDLVKRGLAVEAENKGSVSVENKAAVAPAKKGRK